MMDNTHSEQLIEKVNRQTFSLRTIGFLAFGTLVILNTLVLLLIWLAIQDGRESRDAQLKNINASQRTTVCIVKGFIDPRNYTLKPDGTTSASPKFIDKCVMDNQ